MRSDNASQDTVTEWIRTQDAYYTRRQADAAARGETYYPPPHYTDGDYREWTARQAMAGAERDKLAAFDQWRWRKVAEGGAGELLKYGHVFTLFGVMPDACENAYRAAWHDYLADGKRSPVREPAQTPHDDDLTEEDEATLRRQYTAARAHLMRNGVVPPPIRASSMLPFDVQLQRLELPEEQRWDLERADELTHWRRVIAQASELDISPRDNP
jgi:hypothetical protein